MSRLAALLSALVALLLLAPVAAAEAPVQAPGELTIVEVRCESQSGVANSPANRCEVHDHLVITVAGLDEWARVDPEHNPDRLTLVLNGSRIDGYDAAGVPALPERGDDARVAHLNDLLRQVAAANPATTTFVNGPAEYCADPAIAADLAYRWDGVPAYKPGAKLTFEAAAAQLLAIPV